MTNGSTTATFLYDGDGNRVAKTVGTVTTQYLVDDLNPTSYPQVVEELAGGAVTRQYTYGLQRISENQVVNGAWTPSFYGYDGGGNVRQLTNSVGVVTDTYAYDAFGNELNHTGTTPNNYLYRGEQYDPDLGLYYLRARYYNPLTGRFLSRDPGPGDDDSDESDEADFTDPDGNDLADPATLHKYLYTGGDPVNSYDPDGRSAAINVALLTQLTALTAATGVAVYNYNLHRDETQAALQELGAEISCRFDELATGASAWVEVGLAGDSGTVSRAGPCTFEYKGHRKKTPSKKGKHQKGEGRRAGSRGPGTHPHNPPRKPPGPKKGRGKWKGPWDPSKGW